MVAERVLVSDLIKAMAFAVAFLALVFMMIGAYKASLLDDTLQREPLQECECEWSPQP